MEPWLIFETRTSEIEASKFPLHQSAHVIILIIIIIIIIIINHIGHCTHTMDNTNVIFFVFCFLDRAFSIMKTKINQQNAQINSGLIYY